MDFGQHVFCFFFSSRRRHTRYWRDWSSDVCSSDLQLEGLRSLATVLGAHLLVERGDDVAEVVRRVASERGTTYVLMGAPKPRGAWQRLTRPALPFQLLRA